MEFLGRNADLGAEPELAAVGEGRRDVDVDARRIDPPGELPGRPGVFGDDGFAVARGVAGDVRQSFVEGADGPHGQLVVEEFGPEVLLRGGAEQARGVAAFECGVRLRVGVDRDAFGGHRVAQFREVPEPFAVDDEAVEGVADADAPRLGVADHGAAFRQIAVEVEVGVDDARPGLDHGYAGVFAHEADQSRAAALAREAHEHILLAVAQKRQRVLGVEHLRAQQRAQRVEPPPQQHLVRLVEPVKVEDLDALLCQRRRVVTVQKSQNQAYGNAVSQIASQAATWKENTLQNYLSARSALEDFYRPLKSDYMNNILGKTFPSFNSLQNLFNPNTQF